jgi:hypothetical protein
MDLVEPPPPPVRRSFARRLIRTEPVALVLLLALAVLLFAITMVRLNHRDRSAGPLPQATPAESR